MRDILIHKGNSAGATFTHDGTGFTAYFAKTQKFTPYYYQREALRQMNFGEIETRVLAALNSKQKQA